MCNDKYYCMKRLLLLVGFFTTTPVIVIFSAFFLLFLSQQKSGLLGLLSRETRPFAYAALPSNINVVSDSISQDDGRVGKVTAFLEQFNSPLVQYASLIVNDADKYGIDYRLVPAVGAQESGDCQKGREINGTHNCWGFGIYGKKITSFEDYETGIDTVTRYFANKKSHGVDTLEEIGSIYNPTDHNNWKANVASFMNQL